VISIFNVPEKNNAVLSVEFLWCLCRLVASWGVCLTYSLMLSQYCDQWFIQIRLKLLLF